MKDRKIINIATRQPPAPICHWDQGDGSCNFRLLGADTLKVLTVLPSYASNPNGEEGHVLDDRCLVAGNSEAQRRCNRYRPE